MVGRSHNWLGFTATLFLSCIASMSHTPAADAPREYLAFVGTYTGGGKSEGIYSFRFDPKTGKSSDLKLAAAVINPSFLAIHPDGKHLYSVSETDGAGGISAFEINADGTLKHLNATSTQGGSPCHLVVDRTGKFVLAANYGGGSVCTVPIHEDGSVGEVACFVQHTGHSITPERQAGPHAHSINLDAANKYAFVADLGLDQVLVYKFDAATGELTPNTPPHIAIAPGSGPRHFAFHPSGKYAYVINEILLTVTAMSYDAAHGKLTEIQTIPTIPVAVRPEFSTAEVVVHPSGKFLYGSNRTHDTIAVFTIDPATGKLDRIQNEPTRGKTPRNFAVDPTGGFLFAENQDSGTVVVFRINQADGTLHATGDVLEVGTPVCIKMLAVE
ncbi:MAG: lactonase family protein [Planctomycetaceae bacterium]|nr:lactonase family protein [Planctomycetaceae bacterium]